jgi:hypothetical protein
MRLPAGTAPALDLRPISIDAAQAIVKEPLLKRQPPGFTPVTGPIIAPILCDLMLHTLGGFDKVAPQPDVGL